MAAILTRVATLTREATGPALGEWASSEIAAALTWTEGRAAGELEFAEELAALPVVAAAFDAGRIDHGKARVFTDVLGPAELTPEQAEMLSSTYLAATARLTSGQLGHRLTRALLAIDPEAAACRYRCADTTRQMVGYLSADGSAVISASGLPAEQAAAACARVDELAEQLRRTGPPGGHFHWRSPLGAQYTTRGEPIMPPLPRPCPGPPPPTAGPSAPRYVEGPSYQAPPPPPRPSAGPPAQRHSFWKRPPPEDPEHPAPF